MSTQMSAINVDSISQIVYGLRLRRVPPRVPIYHIISRKPAYIVCWSYYQLIPNQNIEQQRPFDDKIPTENDSLRRHADFLDNPQSVPIWSLE